MIGCAFASLAVLLLIIGLCAWGVPSGVHAVNADWLRAIGAVMVLAVGLFLWNAVRRARHAGRYRSPSSTGDPER